MSHQLVNQDSGSTEYYTEEYLIEMAREVLGNIELDPASSKIANQTVKANMFYNIENDGLSKKWVAQTVWMNHPFSKGEKACPVSKRDNSVSLCKKKGCIERGYHITKDVPGNSEWTNKLVNEYKAGNVKEAICITFSSMSETWMNPLIEFMQCFPRGRINYRLPDGTQTKEITKGSLLTYMGPNPKKFREVFERIGTVKV